MIPYATQSISEEDLAAVREALTSGWLTQGPAVPRFEAAFAQAHEVAHAVAVSSATAGLHIACLVLGVGPGSRVWTSPISYVATANCALYCGATLDFVDIDPTTRNLSIKALTSKLAEAERADRLPHLVIPVHFAGMPCDLADLRTLADRYGFKVLEDASHAVGARYQGASVGSRYADASVFSFHAVKIITTAEGGMVTTQDAAIAHRLRMLRSHGVTRDAADMTGPVEGAWYYEQQALGYNYRMTDVQAALGNSQLARLPSLHRRRIELSQRYDELLRDLPLIRPAVKDDRVSSLHLYAVEIDPARCTVNRAQVFARLRESGVGVNVHYIPIHLQPFWRARGFGPGDFPCSEAYYRQALSIPLYPALADDVQETVVRALRDALS